MASGHRLLIDIIDWGYPEARLPFRPSIYDLRTESDLQKLVLGFGNGIFNEIRAVGETGPALDAFRALATGVGSCVATTRGDIARDLWFYAEGDECLRQGDDANAAIVMIDPVSRPERFS